MRGRRGKRRRGGRLANIFDYLEWRGDVPFSTDPFNEVDNLVLAELAYTDFDGVVAPQGEPSYAPSFPEKASMARSDVEVKETQTLSGKIWAVYKG